MDASNSTIKNTLETIKYTSSGTEFWSARELMKVLDYQTWESFKSVLRRAKDSCTQTGQTLTDHFRDATKMVVIGSSTTRLIEDTLLTRYAAYLVAQNGDPRKPAIAAAQHYFAVQTRKQEVLEKRLTEDNRMEEREKLKETENKIERTVYKRGIKQGVEFASFKNKHIEALYGGLSTGDLKKKRGIPAKRALADFDSDLELKAKNFALGMTDHNIKVKNLTGRNRLEKEVADNSRETRKALLARGIKPELLPPEEDIQQVKKKRLKEQKSLHFLQE